MHEQENDVEVEFEKKDKMILIKVTSTEKKEIEEKAKLYGYRYVSEYIRDACINEKVYINNIKSKKEVLDKVSELVKEVQLLRRDHRYNFRMEEVKEDDRKLANAILDFKEEVRSIMFIESERIK